MTRYIRGSRGHAAAAAMVAVARSRLLWWPPASSSRCWATRSARAGRGDRGDLSGPDAHEAALKGRDLGRPGRAGRMTPDRESGPEPGSCTLAVIALGRLSSRSGDTLGYVPPRPGRALIPRRSCALTLPAPSALRPQWHLLVGLVGELEHQHVDESTVHVFVCQGRGPIDVGARFAGFSAALVAAERAVAIARPIATWSFDVNAVTPLKAARAAVTQLRSPAMNRHQRSHFLLYFSSKNLYMFIRYSTTARNLP